MIDDKPEYYQMIFEHREGKLYMCFYNPSNELVAEREIEDTDAFLTEEMLEIIQGDPRFCFSAGFREN